jgi:hypothetical protein
MAVYAWLKRLPRRLARAVTDTPHHSEDRGGIFGRIYDECLDCAAHEILGEMKSENRFCAFALHREGEAAQV